MAAEKDLVALAESLDKGNKKMETVEEKVIKCETDRGIFIADTQGNILYASEGLNRYKNDVQKFYINSDAKLKQGQGITIGVEESGVKKSDLGIAVKGMIVYISETTELPRKKYEAVREEQEKIKKENDQQKEPIYKKRDQAIQKSWDNYIRAEKELKLKAEEEEELAKREAEEQVRELKLKQVSLLEDLL